ncbi:hypothetical protein POV27_18865 [Aureisphaera galaxeae]|uniref:hypothetical protein n=1 Tax=Aureisphaera galaxeae TaxID=1538023 RepID=UPI0023509A09|nr:hypothetical protein [Aureisphaera galaxeae]MDC8006122.1 hypothetical protein [Aureisphaera galaxeae]
MKYIILPLLFLVSIASAQQSEKYDLQWKVTDTLTYKTIMDEKHVPTEGKEMKMDSLFGELGKSFDKMRSQASKLKYASKLFNDCRGNIDIVMEVVREEEDTTDNMFTSMVSMNGNVMLRGKISPAGELLSHYYNTSQSNLIALLFELPSKPVAIGEKWHLQVDLIAMDQNFVGEEFSKENEVFIEEIREKNGDTVAVIKYNIAEYVSGTFGNAAMSLFGEAKEQNIYMKMTHKATALFSIEKGRWLEYKGNTEIDTNFSLLGSGGVRTTVFELIPE